MSQRHSGCLPGFGSNRFAGKEITTADVERLCNSVNLTLSSEHDLGSYEGKWQPYMCGRKQGVNCSFVFTTSSSEEVVIKASLCCDEKGKLHDRLWLDPRDISGRKIWIGPATLNQMYNQARRAYCRQYLQS